MSVKLTEDMISLIGACHVADAETLAAHLVQQRSRCIDARACVSLHSAVLQVLIAFKPDLGHAPEDRQLRELIIRSCGADCRMT